MTKTHYQNKKKVRLESNSRPKGILVHAESLPDLGQLGHSYFATMLMYV